MSPTVVAARNSAGERERDVVTEIVECVLEDLDAVARGSNREGLIVLFAGSLMRRLGEPRAVRAGTLGLARDPRAACPRYPC